jgi:tRNA(fMet)-specific endonuclease VapC
MYCLETSVIIAILRGDEEIREKANVLLGEFEVFITTITLCEIYKGIHKSHRKEFQTKIINELLESAEVIGLTKESCEEFGNIYYSLSNDGSIIPEPDMMIASIVKIGDLTLVTRDKKHFRRTGVKVEEW